MYLLCTSVCHRKFPLILQQLRALIPNLHLLKYTHRNIRDIILFYFYFLITKQLQIIFHVRSRRSLVGSVLAD